MVWQGLNPQLTSAMTLRDLLRGYVGIGGTDEEIRSHFREYFTKNPNVLPRFEEAYRRMVQDNSATYAEKCTYFLLYPDLTETDALAMLKDTWRLATGRDWER